MSYVRSGGPLIGLVEHDWASCSFRTRIAAWCMRRDAGFSPGRFAGFYSPGAARCVPDPPPPPPPLPGSMDVLTIVLAARPKHDLWFYYAVMATIGSVIGEFVTYRIARRGGKDMLARKFSQRRLQQVPMAPSSAGDSVRSPCRGPAASRRYRCCRSCLAAGSAAVFSVQIHDRDRGRAVRALCDSRILGGPVRTRNPEISDE